MEALFRDQRRWVLVAIGIGVIGALSATAADSDLVSGHVSGGGFKGSRDTLYVVRSDSVIAVLVGLKKNEYGVVLDPGRYRVEFRDRKGIVWADSLEARDEPVHRDVELRKWNAAGPSETDGSPGGQ